MLSNVNNNSKENCRTRTISFMLCNPFNSRQNENVHEFTTFVSVYMCVCGLFQFAIEWKQYNKTLGKYPCTNWYDVTITKINALVLVLFRETSDDDKVHIFVNSNVTSYACDGRQQHEAAAAAAVKKHETESSSLANRVVCFACVCPVLAVFFICIFVAILVQKWFHPSVHVWCIQLKHIQRTRPQFQYSMSIRIWSTTTFPVVNTCELRAHFFILYSLCFVSTIHQEQSEYINKQNQKKKEYPRVNNKKKNNPTHKPRSENRLPSFFSV